MLTPKQPNLPLHTSSLDVKLLTPLECVLKPDVLLQIYTLPCSVTVTLALTLDRWYAITRLAGYTSRSYRYVATLIIIAYAIPLVFVVWVIRYAVTGYPSGYMVRRRVHKGDI